MPVRCLFRRLDVVLRPMTPASPAVAESSLLPRPASSTVDNGYSVEFPHDWRHAPKKKAIDACGPVWSPLGCMLQASGASWCISSTAPPLYVRDIQTHHTTTLQSASIQSIGATPTIATTLQLLQTHDNTSTPLAIHNMRVLVTSPSLSYADPQPREGGAPVKKTMARSVSSTRAEGDSQPRDGG